MPGARPLRRPRASVASAAAGDRNACGPRSRRRRGPRAAGLGGAGDPRSDRAVGAGRSLPPQARPPRLLHRHRVRLALHAAARRAEKPGQAARRAVSPQACFACYAAGSVGAQPHLDLGRNPLHEVQADRLRNHRLSSPATGSGTCSQASRPRRRRSCSSPTRSPTRASSTATGCRRRSRTGCRSSWPGQTTVRR